MPGSQQLLAVELAWCPGCDTERETEVVLLAGDPAPVAVCLDCGCGVEIRWQPAGGMPVTLPAPAARAS